MWDNIKVVELKLIALSYNPQDLSLGPYHCNQQTDGLCISFCTSVCGERKLGVNSVYMYMCLCVCWGNVAWAQMFCQISLESSFISVCICVFVCVCDYF